MNKSKDSSTSFLFPLAVGAVAVGWLLWNKKKQSEDPTVKFFAMYGIKHPRPKDIPIPHTSEPMPGYFN